MPERLLIGGLDPWPDREQSSGGTWWPDVVVPCLVLGNPGKHRGSEALRTWRAPSDMRLERCLGEGMIT
jgi:hypothetical protein